MTKFFATLDANGTHIEEGAYIAAFDTETEAREYLKATYLDGIDEGETISVEPGDFGDCWIKMHGTSTTPEGEELARIVAPLNTDDVCIALPGHHPGGRAVWISPRAEVLVAVINNGDDNE